MMNTDREKTALSAGAGKSTQAPLADAVQDFHAEERISFHVPGHKSRGHLLRRCETHAEGMELSDLTELPGLDDFHDPSGIIAEAEQLAAELFGAEQTFFLVNGTTSGMMAAVAAASTEKDTVILERNTHECSTRGLILSGAVPYYVYNFFDEQNLLPAGISAADLEKALEQCGSVAAVVLTHPSYYGTYSDLRKIVEQAHRAGAAVIVDEAHGAQLAFAVQDGIPTALEAGADIVVQSTHKMLGSFTQSSMLHVQGNIVDRERLRYYISFMNSTSPSYPLMCSLDRARAFLEDHGKQRWMRNVEIVRQVRDDLSSLDGIDCPSVFSGSGGTLYKLESSRLLISAWDRGLTGMELRDLLASKYKIDVEFSDLRYVIALAGINSTEEDFDRLVYAMKETALHPPKERDASVSQQMERYQKVFRLRTDREMTPRKAVTSHTLRLSGNYAEGSVSARDIILYPPGIPVIRAGEVFRREIIDYINEGIRCGMEFHGAAGTGEKGEILFYCAEDEYELRLLNGFF